jgi:hypothetical protein
MSYVASHYVLQHDLVSGRRRAVSVPGSKIGSLEGSIPYPIRKNLGKDTSSEYKLQYILSANGGPMNAITNALMSEFVFLDRS